MRATLCVQCIHHVEENHRATFLYEPLLTCCAKWFLNASIRPLLSLDRSATFLLPNIRLFLLNRLKHCDSFLKVLFDLVRRPRRARCCVSWRLGCLLPLLHLPLFLGFCRRNGIRCRSGLYAIGDRRIVQLLSHIGSGLHACRKGQRRRIPVTTTTGVSDMLCTSKICTLGYEYAAELGKKRTSAGPSFWTHG